MNETPKHTPEQVEDELYNREKFPLFIANHGSWDIYADTKGHCAAIARAKARADGCRSSHFGDVGYTACTITDRNIALRARIAIARATGQAVAP